MEMIVGEKKNNFLLALRIQTVADIYRDKEDFDNCEMEYIKCQTIIGNMFGEDHPAIIPYNGNLVTCYSANKDKFTEKEPKMKAIIAKNF